MEPLLIATHDSGTETLPALRKSVRSAWASVLKDPEASREASQLLNVPLERLGPEPIEIKVGRSGITGAEGAVLIFAAGWLADLGKDLAKDAIEAAAKKLWDRLRPKLPKGAIGKAHKKPQKRKK